MHIKTKGHAAAGLLAVAVAALTVAGTTAAYGQDAEFRAYWVDAWHDGFKTPAQCEQLIQDVQTSNCNAVVVQMRRRGDTYYPSAIEPFASDADPNFDALRYLLDRCHASNPPIQVHAWLVLIPIWTSTNFPTYPHPSNMYPQFLSKTNTGSVVAAFDPGHPDCEQYLNDVVMELVTNYPDLDGISYDYSRFGSQSEGYNDVSIARFNARYNRSGIPDPADPAWCQWRRDQITNLIRKTYVNAVAVNPNICVSSAVVTWYPSPVEAGSFENTRPYYQVFQDWRGWMQEGILDLSMPMCYFDADGSYASCYDNWMNFAKENQFNRGTAIGPGIYMNTITNSIGQVRRTRDFYSGRRAFGVVMYSYASTNKNQAYPNSVFYSALSAPSAFDPNPVPVFSTSVPVPAMQWKTAPTKGHIRGHLKDLGVRIDGAEVYLIGQENRSIHTDGTGFYAFVDVSPGTYTVRVTYNARVYEQSAEVSAGAVTTVDFDFSPTQPPVISNVRVQNVTAYTADVRWDTDQPASSQVEYGLSTAYGFSTPVDPAMVTAHWVRLSGLMPGQTYHFRVRSASTFEAVSGDFTFTTLADSTPPVITNVTVAALEPDRALISWTTDDPSSSSVEYGPTASYGYSTPEDPTPVTAHSVWVNGLSPGTLYYFRVRSTNGVGMSAYSDGYILTTPELPAEVIVDDSDPGCTFTESPPDYVWTVGSYQGGWPPEASSYRFVWNRRTSTSASCEWRPVIPRSGRYDVYIWFLSGSNRTTSARYTVTHADGTTPTIYVNQRDSSLGSQWHKIASGLRFEAGSSGYVRLINRTGETDKTTVVIADAVRFVSIDVDDQPPTAPQNLQVTALSTSQMSVSWEPSSDNVGVTGYRVFRDSVQVGTSSSTTFFDSGLETNRRYTYAVQAYDARQNVSPLSAAVSRYTLSAPPTQADIVCDRPADTWFNSPTFTFTTSGFGVGRVNHYGYVWDTSPSHNWTGDEMVWLSSLKTFSASAESTAWYLHIRGYNGDNIPNGELDLGPYLFDGAPPQMGEVLVPAYVAVREGVADDLSAAWSASDAESGVAEYEYCIGTAPGTADIISWTSAGAATHTARSVPGAQPNLTCYFAVRARDVAGNYSAPVPSGPSVYAAAFDRLAEAMANPDGTPVVIDSGKVIAVRTADYCYVQEPDRSRGLRISAAPALGVGDVVTLAGRLSTENGERCLTDVECSVEGSGAPPAPLAVPIPALGGCAPDAFTPGVPGMPGCYNAGLLVKTWGRVIGRGEGYVLLADGSGGTVKVYTNENVPDNAFVSVVGACGLESGVPVIRTGTAAAVQTY